MNEQISVVEVASTRKRRPRATVQERVEWAKRFAESGLGQREFCRQHGLVLMTLQRWLARVESDGQSAGLSSKVHFTEVEWPAPIHLSNNDCRWAAELSRPKGWIVRLAHDVPPGLVEQLLRVC